MTVIRWFNASQHYEISTMRLKYICLDTVSVHTITYCTVTSTFNTAPPNKRSFIAHSRRKLWKTVVKLLSRCCNICFEALQQQIFFFFFCSRNKQKGIGLHPVVIKAKIIWVNLSQIPEQLCTLKLSSSDTFKGESVTKYLTSVIIRANGEAPGCIPVYKWINYRAQSACVTFYQTKQTAVIIDPN